MMQSRIHPHATAVLRVVAAAVFTAATVAACGADGAGDVALSPAAEAGREVVRSNGCAACHGRNGEGGPGPTFVGLYGSTVELESGETVVADEAYLSESIRDPSAKKVAGYGFPMPENDLTDEQIESVIAFIRELADDGADR